MFFYAAKILWFLAQPSSVIVLTILLGAILVGSRLQRAGRRLLAIGLLALIVCGLSPISSLIIRPLENRFPRPDLASGPPVTGVIILGGGEDARAVPPREVAGLNEAAERYTEAAVLARQLPQARIVFSGGGETIVGPQGAPEAVTAERLLSALGVPRGRITLEDRSRDTYENAVFTKRLLNPKPGERWLLITSAWHMPRAIGCFRKAGFAVEAWPVDYRTSGEFEWVPERAIPDGLRRIDFIVREYVGLVAYYLSGRTSALFPGPAA